MDSFIETAAEFKDYDAVGASCEAELDCKCNLSTPRFRGRYHLNKYQITIILVLILFLQTIVLWVIQLNRYVWMLLMLLVTAVILITIVKCTRSIQARPEHEHIIIV